MRNQIELQRAHDILNNVLASRSLRSIVPVTLQGPLAMAANCLCWALNHDSAVCEHARIFGDLLSWLESDLAEAGLVWGGDPEEYKK